MYFWNLPENDSSPLWRWRPDGNWFAAGDSEGTLRIWNISDRAEVVSKTLNSSAIADIAISPDSAELAVISYDNEVSTWTSDKLREKNRFKVDTNNLNRIVYVTPDLLAAAGETTTIWSVDTGAIKQTISEGRYNYSLARSPDHTRLAYGENDVLQFWDISQAKRTGEFTGGVTTNELVAFSADGHHLATANGSSVRIWDIAANQLLQVIDTFGSPIVGLNWLPVTNLLVVASENSRTRIWGTSTAAQAVHMAPLHSAVDMPDPAAQLSATPAPAGTDARSANVSANPRRQCQDNRHLQSQRLGPGQSGGSDVILPVSADSGRMDRICGSCTAPRFTAVP